MHGKVETEVLAPPSPGEVRLVFAGLLLALTMLFGMTQKVLREI